MRRAMSPPVLLRGLIGKYFSVLLALMLSGCAMPQNSQQWVPYANLSKAPEGAKARVVVLRQKAHIGFILINVVDDLTPIGNLDMGAYLAWDRSPGRSTLKIRLEGLPNLSDEISVEFESGKTHYFRAALSGNRLKSPVVISRLSQEEARSLMSEMASPVN